jgi:hypothetical protein
MAFRLAVGLMQIIVTSLFIYVLHLEPYRAPPIFLQPLNHLDHVQLASLCTRIRDRLHDGKLWLCTFSFGRAISASVTFIMQAALRCSSAPAGVAKVTKKV